MSRKYFISITICVVALGLFGTGTAVAQDQEDAAAQSEGAQEGAQAAEGTEEADQQRKKFSDEIIVTSTRREVSVRELPGSVTVQEGFDLENATLYRNDGSAWESVPSSFSASGPLLYSTDATGLSTWTATAPSSAPAEIRVTAVDLAVDGIRLEWDPNPGATGYTVEARDTMTGGSWAPAAGVTWPIAETTWTDTDIAGRTRRFYRIESTAD